MTTITIDDVQIGNEEKIVFFAGLNVLESSEQAIEVALKLKQISENIGNHLVFKASFDKANRSSVDSFRGPGIEKGIEIFKELKKHDLKIITDVHEINQIPLINDVIDIIQIPAFLCRQTDLIQAACETGKPINIKKGQFLAPDQMMNIIEKCKKFGNEKIMLCERGTSFGYNNLVVDMRSLVLMRDHGYPVVFDATHSLQQPGGQGTKSGGQSEMIPDLARGAVAVGCDALFMEIHPDPSKALSDGPNMLQIDLLPSLLEQLVALDQIVKGKTTPQAN